MPERVTKVTLDAVVSGYVQGMTQAAVATRNLDTAAGKLRAQQEAFTGIGKASMAVGALAAAGVGLAVAKFAEFDKQMSAVQAATHESAANMALLRDAALDAGAETVFSATESASAIEELAKAGLSTSEILGGALDGALSLAAASGMNVADAAEVAAKTLNQFNLAGSKTEHVADLLAAGAGKASGDVSDLGAALAQVGQVANGAGLTIEETTTALAAFASQGLLGSDAGTSFKTMLGALTPNTAKARDEMERLGISAFDAGGKFIGLENFAGQLKQGLSGLTDEQRSASLEIMFGSDAVRAATALYNEGSVGIADWSEKVNDSGYAAETAALRMDNLSGDIEKLGGAFDTALIKTGSAANDALRGLVQGVTSVVDAFGDAPQAVQTTALALGGLTAAVGLAGGAALIAVPKVAAFKASLEALGISAAKTNAAVANLKTGMTILAAVGVGAWAAEATGGFIDSAREALGLKETVDSLIGSLDELGAKTTVDNLIGDDLNGIGTLTDNGFFSDVTRGASEAVQGISNFMPIWKLLGSESQLTTAQLSLADDAMSKLVADGKPDEAAAMYEALAAKTNGSKDALGKLNDLLPEYSSAQDGAATATEDASEEVDTFTAATDSATQTVSDFVDALRGLGDTQLSLNDANRKVESSLDDFQASIEKNGQTLDITTEAGRENSAALDAIAESYKTAAAATVEQTGKQEDAIPVIQAGRDAIVKAGMAAGLSAEQANAYADQLDLIPGDVETLYKSNAAQAIAEANAVARAINSIPGYRDIVINQVVQETGRPRGEVGAAYPGNANGGMYSYADGGFGEGFYSGRAGALYKFAEPEVGWEAFISGKPGKEAQNRGYALEAYKRLGGEMGGKTEIHYNLSPTFPAIRDNDPRTQATILGREFARKVAG
ncbi:phage tail tape measure protein, TP901 family, core region [Agromyces sp. CF514]|uniref:phage tail tape measure protein n=1 Tax=Agromyces sp. CF514 TaxID=1881031 RepID=UPI0008E9E781|nr:phage tail tape measure protein [Agromyces sp. CF514]SFR76135.1 phage tail tape measure protein, TP901 family, core region [Agromyces sp. CF514]